MRAARDKPLFFFYSVYQSMAGSVLSLNSPIVLFQLKSRMKLSADRTVSLFNLEKRSVTCCSSKKKKNIGFMDQILDYIEGMNALFL